MPSYEFSPWDGSQEFSPQSADEFFEQFSEYLVEYGEQVMPNLEDWEQEHPDLVEMLMQQGYVDKDADGKFVVTPKGFRKVENKALEELFDITRKDQPGQHETEFRGTGQVLHDETRPYRFGDPVSNLDMHQTLKNALVRTGGGTPIGMSEEDFVVHDTEYSSTCATVVLVDMSGSMSRWGKYAGAKKVALALQGLVRGKYQGDFLQTVGFYTYASAMKEKELLMSAPKRVSIFDSRVYLRIDLDNPPGFVPEHFTNIQAGLQFARKILKRQPQANKQIICITDGEPTAHIEGREVVLIYPPSDKSANATLAEAKRCRDEGIHLSSFALIDDYFYLELVNFVEKMAQVSGGVAAYCNANDLGNMVIDSFIGGRKKRRRV